MTTGITRHLPRFIVSLLFAIGLLVGGMATPAQAATMATQTPKTGSQAFSPNWGIHPGSSYICCYTGKGEDVLFVHGVDGNKAPSGSMDCKGALSTSSQNGTEFADALAYLQSQQWVGNLFTLSYYSGDYNCDKNMRTSAHAYHCNGYYDSVVGNNNEDDRHLACLLAWYIWDNYTVNTWTVNVVAHSLGGVLLKEALYKISQSDSHFPAYLSLDHVVTISSPLGGIPATGAHWTCQCAEVAELQWGGGAIYGDLTSQAGRNARSIDNNSWLMEGEAGAQCDQVGDSAFQMNYGIKVDYSYQMTGISGMQDACSSQGGYYYGHGTYLQDNQTVYNATVNYCNTCTGDPDTVKYNYPRSLVEMFWGLAGTCAASPNIKNCDGDDPGVTSCSSTGHQQSGDVSYLRIYWSTGCSTNWASVNAPSGYLVKVTLVRSPTGSWSNVDRHFIYCAPSRTSCPNDTWWAFGQYTTSWVTDMLYAPNEKVAVQIVTSTGATYTSIWH